MHKKKSYIVSLYSLFCEVHMSLLVETRMETLMAKSLDGLDQKCGTTKDCSINSSNFDGDGDGDGLARRVRDYLSTPGGLPPTASRSRPPEGDFPHSQPPSSSSPSSSTEQLPSHALSIPFLACPAPQILAPTPRTPMEVSEQASWPDDFRCPISLEVMTDPVILPSGHTFERRSIQRWLDGGHLTCPVTNLPLPPSPPLIPNHALRRLIAAVSAAAVEKGGDGERQEVVPASSSSVSGLLRLAKSGAAGRREVLESGAAAVLLRHAAAGDEAAARALVHLSLDGDDARVGLVADGAVDALSAAVSGGGAAAALAATALTSLATVDVNKCTIGAHPLAIPALAALLRRGGPRERREAATTLYELCKLPENRRRAVRVGAVPALADLAAAGSARAVEVLGLLAKNREGRQELSKIPDIVPVLSGVASGGNARAIEQALLVLNWICSESNELAMEAIKLGAFHLCEALVNDDNCKLAKNAVELARTLEKA